MRRSRIRSRRGKSRRRRMKKGENVERSGGREVNGEGPAVHE